MMPTGSTTPNARADWFAARALLATRRLIPRLPWAVLAFVLVFAGVVIVRGPWAQREAETRRAAALARAAERDTFPLVAAHRRAVAELAARDSVLRVQQTAAAAHGPTPQLSAGQQQERDSLRALLNTLEGALARAARAPLPASYHALAGVRALRSTSGAQALDDTLTLLDRARQALDPVEAPQSEFARLSQRANAIGQALQAMGQARRTALLRQVSAIESATPAARDTTVAVDTQTVRLARDHARARVQDADSVLRAARQWHTALQRRADSLAADQMARIIGTSPFAAAFGAMLLVLVFVYAMAVVAEARAPTVAHAREVERLTGLPVLATAQAFVTPREGRARLQSGSAVDPFRMMYLALTASGTRERAVSVTGDDVSSVITAAARLAVSAAADKHATLLLDLAPNGGGTAAYFGARDEPGFSDALAGVRLWREVARPIGASDGMTIDVVPAGAPRQDLDDSVQSTTARAEFDLFASEYDFTVLSAPTEVAANRATKLVPNVPTIVVVRLARSRIKALSELVSSHQESGVRLHGILLVESAT